MRRAVSPMPIGLTPGFLSSAMRRQASRGEIHGSRKVEQRRLAVRAKEWQRALEAVLKDVHSLLQVYASSPDGPAAPLDGHQGAHPSCKVESGEAPFVKYIAQFFNYGVGLRSVIRSCFKFSKQSALIS